MRHFRQAAIAAVCVLAFAQISLAADLPRKAPAAALPPPVSNWTGFYVGANIGGGWGHESVDYAALDPLTAGLFGIINNGAPPSASVKSSGVLGGLQLGYNWQIGPAWLVGVEADIDWSGVKGSAATGGAILGITPFTNTVETKVKWLGTARGRLGYFPAANLLAFVTGGFAYGEVEHTGTYTTNGPGFGQVPPFGFQCTPNIPCFAAASSNTAFGWTVGGGLEYALAQNWTVRGEYLYVSLASKSVTETATALNNQPLPSTFAANFGRTNLNIARVAFNYRF
jgi:outer membrane immunogenic protein